MKVLVPLDIIHQAKPTIDQLKVLLDLKDAEVTLLYVKEELPSYPTLVGENAQAEADMTLQVQLKTEAVFEDAKLQLKGLCSTVHTDVAIGPPAMMIDRIAREQGFSVTVVTPGTHSRVEQFLMGSVSSSVLKHGPDTIVVCRPTKKPLGKLTHVLMGIDGSQNSRYALERAAKVLALNSPDVRVTLVHIVTVADIMKLVSPVEYIAIVENNLLMEGETHLADGEKILAAAGIKKISCVLKEGDPTNEIISLAHSLPADLIVIGAQGRTAVEHFLLGSVSHRIAMCSPCSVAVIKPQ